MRHALSLLVLALFSACAPDSVLLIELADAEAVDASTLDAALLDASNDARSRSDGGPVFCTSNDDCKISELCEMLSCEAAFGTCQDRPFCDDGERGPVCGCDGVLYYSNCLRRQERVSATRPLTMCRTTCSSYRDCPRNALCGRILPDRLACGADTPLGLCWKLPSDCGSDARGRYESCSGTEHCESLCRAVASGDPYYVDFDDSCSFSRP